MTFLAETNQPAPAFAFFCHPDRSGEPALSEVERVATLIQSPIDGTTTRLPPRTLSSRLP
jgi:hypothetical protein